MILASYSFSVQTLCKNLWPLRCCLQLQRRVFLWTQRAPLRCPGVAAESGCRSCCPCSTPTQVQQIMHKRGSKNPHISHPKPKPCVYPERAIIGGTEHFGLIGGWDDGQGIHCAHVARQSPHLLFGLNVPNLIHRKRREITILTMCWHFQVSMIITLAIKALQGVEINTTYMNKVLVGATNYMMIGDRNGVHAASRGLEHMDTLQRTDVPDLRGKSRQTISQKSISFIDTR